MNSALGAAEFKCDLEEVSGKLVHVTCQDTSIMVVMKVTYFFWQRYPMYESMCMYINKTDLLPVDLWNRSIGTGVYLKTHLWACVGVPWFKLQPAMLASHINTGSSSDFSASLLTCVWTQWKMDQALGLPATMWEIKRVFKAPGFIQPGPASDFVAIWGTNQWMEISLSPLSLALPFR